MRTELGAAILLVSPTFMSLMAAAIMSFASTGIFCCEGDAAAVVRDPAFIRSVRPRVADQIALYTHRHDHAHSASGAIVHARTHDHSHHDHDHQWA